MTSLMKIPAIGYEMSDQYGGVTEKKFCARADIKEGVSGCAPVDSTFENTEREQILAPKSESRPRDAIGGGKRTPENYRGDKSQYRGEWDGDGPYIPTGGPSYGENGQGG